MSAELPSFTSHYVSINSSFSCLTFLILLYLHPTMYLLIQTITITTANTISRFTSHYVSINSEFEQALDIKAYLFTSHYVSINSSLVAEFIPVFIKFTSHYVSINSSAANNVFTNSRFIYIPLCIY